ncbi:uncharacterized protein [Haliotis asinina]|uniref:uncharacterized protein n=1 Tax=Haliotis asinina TaxID=109174 RepID=UPI00353190DA
MESGLQQLVPNGNVDYLRHQIIDTIKNAPKPRSNLTHQERQAITELKKDDSITITEADKGKAAVIMDTPEFLQFVNNSLSDSTTYLNIEKDPTARMERQHKKTLKDFHEKREINDIMFNQLNPTNSQAPYGRAIIKIHKNPPKARILVCSRGSGFYNTTHFLSHLLAPFGKDEIFMTSFEEAALSTASFQHLCWYRKVDDTFTAITNDNDPSEFLNQLKDQHPRIKLTMETETNQHLPFFDVSLHTTDDAHRIVHPLKLPPPSSDQASYHRHPYQTSQSPLPS